MEIVCRYPDNIDAETAALIDKLAPPPMDTYEDQLNRVKEAATNHLVWLNVIGQPDLAET